MVKKKLIDMDKTQYWLTEEVNKKLGISTDNTYVNRVLRGAGQDGMVKAAICEILGISA